MRVLSEVIDQCLEFVPSDNEHREMLISIATSSLYAAPERQRDLWRQGAEVIMEIAGEPAFDHEPWFHGWKLRMLETWRGPV